MSANAWPSGELEPVTNAALECTIVYERLEPTRDGQHWQPKFGEINLAHDRSVPKMRATDNPSDESVGAADKGHTLDLRQSSDGSCVASAHGTILVVLHSKVGSSGLVGESLIQRGFQVREVRTVLGQPLPKRLDNLAGVVVFGGPMSANDDHETYIRRELDWIPRVLAADLPLLGICLGAQLMARTLGARVQPHPDRLLEAGYYRISPTREGKGLFGSEPMWVYQWHAEGMELPPGATLLAEGDRFPVQAYRCGQQAFGVQFHPEMTYRIVERWTTGADKQLAVDGARPPEAHRRDHRLYAAGVRNWLERFWDIWILARQ